MPGDKLIFVSCGQITDDEKELGVRTKNFVDSQDGFHAYFAERVHDLTGLAENIFDALRRCSGMVAFLHARGRVLLPNDAEWGIRSSVWINQELAILAYRSYFESWQIPVLVFEEEGVKLEGAMSAMIVNPVPLQPDRLEDELGGWLATVGRRAPLVSSDDVFAEKWETLSEQARYVLLCLVEEGGRDVHVNAMYGRLQGTHGRPGDVRDAQRELLQAGFLRVAVNDRTGNEWSINDTWLWQITRALAEWRAGA